MSKTDEALKAMGIENFPFDEMNKAAFDDLENFDKLPSDERKTKWGRLLTADAGMQKVFGLIKETPKPEMEKLIDESDFVGKIITIVATYAIVGNKQGWMAEGK